MAMFENFPYTDMHQLNLDWIIKIAKDFLDQYTHIQQLISDGETSLQNITADGLEQLETKANNLESLLQEWYNTHSQDIANQLADALQDLNDWYTLHQNYLDQTLVNKINAFNTAADQKAAQTIASIPSDYTALSNQVQDLEGNSELLKFTPTWRTGYYIGNLGNYIQYSSFNATEKIPLFDETNFLRRDFYFKVKLNTATYICYYDKNGNLLDAETTDISGSEVEYETNTKAHTTAYYVAVSNFAEYTPVILACINKAVIGTVYDVLPNKNNLFDPYDTRTRVNKYFDPNGIITLNGFAITHPIPIKGGISYSVTYARSEFGASTQYAITDETGNILAYRQNIPITTDNVLTFTEQNDCYVIFNMSLNVTGRAYFRVQETEVFNTSYEVYNGVLKGKRILYNGDSITESRYEGMSANGGSFPKMINNIIHGSYQNRAVGGGTIAQHGTAFCISDDIDNMDSTGDLICLEGGVNDYWGNVPLGDFQENAFNNTLDPTTFCGAMESMFRKAINKWVGKPIVFIIIHKVTGTAWNTNSQGYSFKTMREKMIGICNKYSIPYVDIWGEGGLNPYMQSLNEAYMNGGANVHPDGCHPDANGYMLYYVPRLLKKFEEVMK